MLRSFKFNGIEFQLLPEPVTVTVKPESAKHLSQIPSHRFISVLGYRKQEKLVLFAKPGETIPIDRLYEGHIADPPEKWMHR